MIFVVIAVLVAALVAAALVYSSTYTFYVLAAPMNPNFGSGDCHISGPDETGIPGYLFMACCWYEDGEEKCQICEKPHGGEWGNCGEVHSGKALPTSDITPPQDGVLEQTPSPPTPRGAPTLGEIAPEAEQPPTSPLRTPGQSILPQDGGVLEQQDQPTDQGAAEPRGDEPAPPTSCPEGQILDEESGLCVLEESEVQQSEEEESEQSEPEENDSEEN